MTSPDRHLEQAYEDRVSGGIELDLPPYNSDDECEICGAPLPDYDIEASGICKECKERVFDNGTDYADVSEFDAEQLYARYDEPDMDIYGGGYSEE